MSDGTESIDETALDHAGAAALALDPVPMRAADLADALYAKVTWRTVPILCIGFLVAYIDRANVGFAKLQMLADLSFTDSVYGLGSGLFFVGYILFEVPSNVALKRVGAKVWLALIMVVWGILSGATVLCRTPAEFYILRLLLGVTEAGFFPGVLFYFACWYPLARRSRVTALFLLAIPLSGMIGSPLSGWIMTSFQGRQGLAGWQWLFVIEALPALLLALVTFRLLPSSIASENWLTGPEKRRLLEGLDADGRSDDVHSIFDALRDSRVWLVGVIDVTILLGMYSIIFWLPTILRGTGSLSIQTTGLLTAIPHLTGMIAMMVLGWHSDKLRERRWHVALPMTVGALALAASTLFPHSVAMTTAAFSIANAGVMGALPALLCIPGAFLRGGAAAAGLALVSSIGNLAGFFSTYLTGRILDVTHSVSAAMLIFAMCLVLGSMIVFRLPADLVDR